MTDNSINYAMVIPSLLCLAFYLLASLAAIHRLLDSQATRWPLLSCAWIAMALHAGGLGPSLLAQGLEQNMSLLNVASFVALLISLVMSLIVRRFNGWILLPVTYGFAALLQTINALMPSQYLVRLEQRPELLAHITLALLAFSVLMIATLFTLLLAYLDYHLKSRKRLALPQLPPLLAVERRIYQLIALGVGLLTLSIACGAFFLDEMFAPEQRDKAILTFLAWSVYCTLLWGHHRHGWRGNTLILMSLFGSGLLFLAYFGSRLLKELLLN